MIFATPNAAQNLCCYRNGPNAKHSAELPADLLRAVAAPRTSRERAESMPILSGTRIHAVATPATLPDAGDACDRS